MPALEGGARIYGTPPGADLPRILVEALVARKDDAPEGLARTTLLLNTRRLERRVRALFDGHAPLLLPRIDLVTDLAHLTGLAPGGTDLRRFLSLAQVLDETLARIPDLAHPAAAVDLAQSIGALLDEMAVEGVAIEALEDVALENQSEHWDRNRRLLGAIGAYLAADPALGGAAARNREATDRLIAAWRVAPPRHPVILAGSTGSRGTTFDLMCAVAGLPQGAVILPGFDFDLPASTWDALRADRFDPVEDHPQYRFARLLSALDMSPDAVRPLGDVAEGGRRRALVSLCLRPAPVTDAWLAEGPGLGDLAAAVDGVTLLEAATLRDEAEAIALCLRGVVEEGKTGAVITSNRVLTRRIAAALDRWGIVPDDSAGEPLGQTPPGRLVLQVAELRGAPVAAEELVALLKHPLVAAGEGRGAHLRLTRELELWLRGEAVPFVDGAVLEQWIAGTAREDAGGWAAWLGGIFAGLGPGPAPVSEHAARTLATCGTLAAGPAEAAAGAPEWEDEAGLATLSVLDSLRAESAPDHIVGADGWRRLAEAAIRAKDVREAVITDPRVMIWGPLEARVHGADVVVLAGLNEGTWPEAPSPDPWLNRPMRRALGLLSPERSVGLAAHDFQSAVTTGEVVLSRAVQEDGAVTVPSRWLSRMTNLLQGLPETGGEEALSEMRARGETWLARVREMRRVAPVSPEPRPAPRPPVEARPKRLPVTAIQRLIRDPYAVYARYVLRLRPVGPLRQISDPALRGQILHEIFDRFTREARGESAGAEEARLLTLSHEVLEARVPWPAARRLWHARIGRIAEAFVAWDLDQRARRAAVISETKGQVAIPEIAFDLEGRADRITTFADGTLEVVDFKTGKAPTRKEIEHFDRQLVLEALIAEAGGFRDVPAAPVASVAHIGLSPEFALSVHGIGDGDELFDLGEVRRGLITLIAAYQREDQGYAARRAMASVRFEGDYDHLARLGEWDDEARPVPVTLR